MLVTPGVKGSTGLFSSAIFNPFATPSRQAQQLTPNGTRHSHHLGRPSSQRGKTTMLIGSADETTLQHELHSLPIYFIQSSPLRDRSLCRGTLYHGFGVLSECDHLCDNLPKTNAYRTRKIVGGILEVLIQNSVNLFCRLTQFPPYSRFFFFIHVSSRYGDT